MSKFVQNVMMILNCEDWRMAHIFNSDGRIYVASRIITDQLSNTHVNWMHVANTSCSSRRVTALISRSSSIPFNSLWYAVLLFISFYFFWNGWTDFFRHKLNDGKHVRFFYCFFLFLSTVCTVLIVCCVITGVMRWSARKKKHTHTHMY